MPSSGVAFARETLDLAAEGASAHGRDDLARRLAGARRLLTGPSATVHVVGEFKQGKSSLVNGLLASPVCPVDDDVATAVPTRVAYAPSARAQANYATSAGSDGAPWTEDVPVDDVAAYVTETGNPGNRRDLQSFSIGVDVPLLASGLALVDSPGVGGLGSVHHAVAVGELPQAHAVLFVSDASQELSAAELRFLRTVHDLCSTVVFVLTKIDVHAAWEHIRDLDAGHLRGAGLDLEILPVSSELREMAIGDDDPALDVESGFPVLVERLEGISEDAERLALRAVAGHVLSVVDQLESALQGRMAPLTTPERSRELVAGLTAARERVDALRERSSRWQQVLSDGFADISSDTEYELRRRSRAVLHDAEREIEDGDPATDWPAFEQWLRQRLAAEAMENYGALTKRTRELTERVDEQFEDAAGVVPRSVPAPVAMVDAIEIDSRVGGAPVKRFAGGMAGFQRGFGGFMMFTVLSNLAGLALPVPWGLGLGLAMGRMGLKEERRRQLERRRTDAKVAVRRFVDEFDTQIGKDSRDAVRRIQRELRQGYTDRVEELRRSTTDALSAAQTAMRSGEAETDELGRLQADMRTLARLRGRTHDILERTRGADGLAAPPVGPERS